MKEGGLRRTVSFGTLEELRTHQARGSSSSQADDHFGDYGGHAGLRIASPQEFNRAGARVRCPTCYESQLDFTRVEEHCILLFRRTAIGVMNNSFITST